MIGDGFRDEGPLTRTKSSTLLEWLGCRDHLSGFRHKLLAVVKCGQRRGTSLAFCRRSEWRPPDPQSVTLLYPSQAGISLPAVILPGLILSLSWCFLLPPVACAQAVYGSIFGTVTDQSGAAVTDARMTITSVQKGSKVETTTNAAGNYSVIHLIPDQYNVHSEA